MWSSIGKGYLVGNGWAKKTGEIADFICQGKYQHNFLMKTIETIEREHGMQCFFIKTKLLLQQEPNGVIPRPLETTKPSDAPVENIPSK